MPAAWAEPATMGTSPEGNPIPKLARFYTALARLAAKQRKDNVHIAWLGDSHTQADIWTEAVRAPLQQRFGVGGPGFVHVGWTTYGYRHAGIVLSVAGKWGVEPKTLVTGEKEDDGVFGLGGVRLMPRQGGSRATVRASTEALPGRSRWDLAYRFTEDGSSFRAAVVGGEPRGFKAEAGTLGKIQHAQFETAGPGGELQVTEAVPGVQLFGAVVETSGAPGVVLDTLGLNGARVRSALAYDETTWEAELARRHPDLVVLVYGTNESSDVKINKEVHARRVKQLVARARAAAPETDCLIFGPIDRGGERYEKAVEDLNDAQRMAAAELGCAFWSGQVTMGGKGSMARWASESPPLAAGDHVHLQSRGYQRIGDALARDLMQGYGLGVGR